MIRRAIIFAALCLPLASLALPAHAQLGNSFTPDQARSARDSGDVVPLKDIFQRLKRQYGGYQIDANLFNRGNGQVYVIDWMTEKGERVRFTVDAKSGRVISRN
ncbi:MAG: hypothetical protein Hens3KO_04280 [Henriciella sp.]